MKYIYLTTILLILTRVSFSQTRQLENGTYQVNINSESYESYDLRVKDSLFIEYYKNETYIGKIKWINRNTFELVYDKESENKFGELVKKLHESFGYYCYEIYPSGNNRYRLKITYSIHSEIIVNTGEMVKKEIEKIKLPR
ncbi:MAG TPA: hypothetical protein VMV32_11280 [Ignavibacteriaceae bacterium]|nr:hypothetical protein [Ignavibacteriaceae bacterium]